MSAFVAHNIQGEGEYGGLFIVLSRIVVFCSTLILLSMSRPIDRYVALSYTI